MIRNVYARICELNAQLVSYTNQICVPDWQQEFLKTGINEYSSTWDQILSKAEALEMVAEIAIAELMPARDDERDREEGEVPPTKPPPKKKKMANVFKSKNNLLWNVK